MGFSPNVAFNGAASFTQPAFDGSVTLLWDFLWTDNQYRTNFNDPSSDMGEHFVTNARVTYRPDNGKWEASFFVQNFTDETNLIKADPFPGFKFRPGRVQPTPLVRRDYQVEFQVICQPPANNMPEPAPAWVSRSRHSGYRSSPAWRGRNGKDIE